MIGKTLGHYRMIEKLDEGGMGVVYKARDIDLDCFAVMAGPQVGLGVTVSTMPPNRDSRAYSPGLFLSHAGCEVRLAAFLEHDSCPPSPGERIGWAPYFAGIDQQEC